MIWGSLKEGRMKASLFSTSLYWWKALLRTHPPLRPRGIQEAGNCSGQMKKRKRERRILAGHNPFRRSLLNVTEPEWIWEELWSRSIKRTRCVTDRLVFCAVSLGEYFDSRLFTRNRMSNSTMHAVSFCVSVWLQDGDRSPQWKQFLSHLFETCSSCYECSSFTPLNQTSHWLARTKKKKFSSN